MSLLPLGMLPPPKKNSCTYQKFVILEHTVARKQFVFVMHMRQCQPLQEKEISCGKYRRKMTVSRLTRREMLKKGKRK